MGISLECIIRCFFFKFFIVFDFIFIDYFFYVVIFEDNKVLV